MGITDWFSGSGLVELVALLVKLVIVLILCLQISPIMLWVERRGPAMMQRRKGPNRVGLFRFRLWGLIQSLADTVKLIFKEEIVPKAANRKFFHIAPMIGVIPAFLIAAAIPYGPDVTWKGQKIPLALIHLDVGFLFILAISSLAVYCIALSGWACNNKFSLLGALRSSAQMVSYEIPMGLALVPLVLIYQTFDLNLIASKQASIGSWGLVLAPISFLLFFISMFAETNRAPFDLAEADSELIAGFHTEYGTTKFALFFMAEYTNMFVLACLISTLFLGGWQIPFISHETISTALTEWSPLWGSLLAGLIGMVVLLLKASLFMWLYVWVRWTLPRFRYDQLMNLGWKFMLPIGLANVVVTALVIAWKTF